MFLLSYQCKCQFNAHSNAELKEFIKLLNALVDKNFNGTEDEGGESEEGEKRGEDDEQDKKPSKRKSLQREASKFIMQPEE